MIAGPFYPKDIIVRLSDFKSNEYANLLAGRRYEPRKENSMLGFCGTSRYYDPRYREGFALQCRPMHKVRTEMGLTNLKLMIPFCRTVEEGKKVLAEICDGISIGSNDLTQLVLGVDRDSESVALLFDERNPAVTRRLPR